MPTIWNKTRENIEQDFAGWERGTPRFIGKDGMFRLGLRPPSKSEKSLREKQKLERKSTVGHGNTEETDEEADKSKVKEMTQEMATGEDKRKNQKVERSKIKIKKDYTGIKRRQRLEKKEKDEYEQRIELISSTK